MCNTLRASHYHHHRLQLRGKGVISKVQMRRGRGCCSHDRGGDGIVTRRKKDQSAFGTVVIKVVESGNSDNFDFRLVEEVRVFKPFSGAEHHQGVAIRGDTDESDQNVLQTISILMYRDILVNVENQSMWPSKWD